jgi:hypothetical protein
MEKIKQNFLLMKTKFFIETEPETSKEINEAKTTKVPLYYIKAKIMGNEFYCNDKKIPVLNKKNAFKTNNKQICEKIIKSI